MEYTGNYDTPEIWWSTCRQPDNFIQELALKIFAITPHQAACEQVFSVLNWMTGKRRTRLDIAWLQSMAQIHSYYITNARSELRFSSSNMDVDELEAAIQEVVTAMINNDDLFVEEEEGDEMGEDNDIFSDNDDVNSDEVDMNNLLLADVMNLNIPEFGERNEDDANSNIGIQSRPVNHGNPNVDFEALLNEESEE